MLIVGIDAATKPNKVGVVWGDWSPATGLAIEEADLLSRLGTAALSARLAGAAHGALVAVDAPLGWPLALGRGLHSHQAGAPLAADADHLFSRACDRMIWKTLRKRPMEVGANLIARTAAAALGLVQALREATRLPLPMGWSPGQLPTQPEVLEVYPAATRLVHGLPKRDTEAELALLRESGVSMSREAAAVAVASDHVLDAMFCCLAAMDYLEGGVFRPGDAALGEECSPPIAAKEGWIWVRRPAAT